MLTWITPCTLQESFLNSFIYQPWREIYIRDREGKETAAALTAILNLVQSYQRLLFSPFFPYTVFIIVLPVYLLNSSPFLFSIYISLSNSVIALYPNCRKRNSMRSSLGLLCFSRELCYLFFFSVPKPWRVCFQHSHTCTQREKQEQIKRS